MFIESLAVNWIGTSQINIQEFNDPNHRSRLCMEWKHEDGVIMMGLPSKSSDMNPIDNMSHHRGSEAYR